jgi:hypothetical protein
MRNTNRAALAAVTGVILLTAVGCVDTTAKGDETTYGYSWWVPVAVFAAALVSLPLGLVLRRSSGRLGRSSVGLMLLCPILLVLVFPMMLTDKVRVDKDRFEAHYGIWFAPSNFNIRFDDLSAIRRVTYEVRTRRGGRSTRHKLLCVHKNGGQTDTVQSGTIVSEAAPEILRHAAEHGVAVTEERQ